MNYVEETMITKNNKDALRKSDMSPEEILVFLENGAMVRGFRNMVMKVYSDDDADKMVAKRLADMLGGNADSIRKNVSNWFNDKNVPQRDQLFQICFALGLDDEKANLLLAYASETEIHYRNPEEIIYAYCLKFGKAYAESQRLIAELIPKCGDYKNIKNAADENAKTAKHLRDEFESTVTDDDTLEAFLVRNTADLGVIHIAAYVDFMKMLGYLQDPDRDYSDNYYDYMKKHRDEYSEHELEKMKKHQDGLAAKSVADVVNEYMQMHVPENTSKNGRKSAKRDFTYLQKAIKKNWPSENIIFKMKNQDIDVSRKVMLLLFLLTEEFEVSVPAGADDDDSNFYYYSDSLEADDDDPVERMEIRLKQINLFLDEYGMKRLDPGNPFDFLMLYALKASYEGESDYMSERMENVLGELFASEE